LACAAPDFACKITLRAPTNKESKPRFLRWFRKNMCFCVKASGALFCLIVRAPLYLGAHGKKAAGEKPNGVAAQQQLVSAHNF